MRTVFISEGKRTGRPGLHKPRSNFICGLLGEQGEKTFRTETRHIRVRNIRVMYVIILYDDCVGHDDISINNILILF